MAPIEILALLFGIATLLKMLSFFFTPKWAKEFSEIIFNWLKKNSRITMLISLAVAGIVGYYVLQTLTIIDIAAVMLFIVILIGIALIPFSKEFDKLAGTMLSKQGIKKCGFQC